MVFAVPFAAAASAFAAANMGASVHCWYSSGRRIMLASGALHSSLVCFGLWYNDEYPLLAHAYAGLCSSMASAHYFLHLCRVPSLQQPVMRNYMYFGWIGLLFVFGAKELRWSYALADE